MSQPVGVMGNHCASGEKGRGRLQTPDVGVPWGPGSADFFAPSEKISGRFSSGRTPMRPLRWSTVAMVLGIANLPITAAASARRQSPVARIGRSTSGSGPLYVRMNPERTSTPENSIDQTALITGGGRGLGRSFALGLAATGMAVAVVARTEEELAETVRQVETAGGRAEAFRADVSVPQDVADTVTAVDGGVPCYRSA
jgi:hypothetical protein